MINIKPGVQFHLHTFSNSTISRIPLAAYFTSPTDYHPTITSGCDGKHKVNSKHYTGKALDFRIRDFPADPATWAGRMQAQLGDEYFVGLELKKNHIHVQFNG